MPQGGLSGLRVSAPAPRACRISRLASNKYRSVAESSYGCSPRNQKQAVTRTRPRVLSRAIVPKRLCFIERSRNTGRRSWQIWKQEAASCLPSCLTSRSYIGTGRDNLLQVRLEPPFEVRPCGHAVEGVSPKLKLYATVSKAPSGKAVVLFEATLEEIVRNGRFDVIQCKCAQVPSTDLFFKDLEPLVTCPFHSSIMDLALPIQNPLDGVAMNLVRPEVPKRMQKTASCQHLTRQSLQDNRYFLRSVRSDLVGQFPDVIKIGQCQPKPMAVGTMTTGDREQNRFVNRKYVVHSELQPAGTQPLEGGEEPAMLQYLGIFNPWT